MGGKDSVPDHLLSSSRFCDACLILELVCMLGGICTLRSHKIKVFFINTCSSEIHSFGLSETKKRAKLKLKQLEPFL